MSGWVEVSCDVADAIRMNDHLSVYESLTDLSGEFGEPRVYTLWGWRDLDRPVLKETRWPGPEGTRPDARPCVHLVPNREASS